MTDPSLISILGVDLEVKHIPLDKPLSLKDKAPSCVFCTKDWAVWPSGKVGQRKSAKVWAAKAGFIHAKAMGNLKAFQTCEELEDFHRTTCTGRLWKFFPPC